MDGSQSISAEFTFANSVRPSFMPLLYFQSPVLSTIRKGATSRKIKLDQTSVVVGMCSMLFYYFQLCFSAGSAAKRRGFHYVAGERPQRTPGREVPSWVPRVLLWFGFGHV